jgi:hypothetical protein
MPDSPRDVLARIRHARELLAAGKAQDGLRELTSICSSRPDPLADEGSVAEAVALLGDFARTFGDAQLAAKLDACRGKPQDPQALYDAAYDLYEQRQFAAASALLYRANAIAPGQSAIVGELATNLEHQLRYGEAALVVDLSGIAETSPLGAYLSGFHWMMVGDVEKARQRVAGLAGVADARMTFMRDALAGMVARADAMRAAGMALDDRALAAWQAVLSGTLLLHVSPHGHPDPMRGRYAYVGDSAALEREGLERLKALLAARGMLPPRIVAAPDRSSRILALAAASLFGVPLDDRGPADAGPALVVAWTMEAAADVEFLRAMHDHRPGQTLFVHASCWTEPFVYAPDVTTLLHQTVTSPWSGGALKVDPETRSVVPADPDPRPDEAIAQEILTAPASDPSVSSMDEILAIARALDGAAPEHRGGLGRAAGKRMHQRAGGPVPSNRFL